jgi:hypothetical protein
LETRNLKCLTELPKSAKVTYAWGKRTLIVITLSHTVNFNSKYSQTCPHYVIKFVSEFWQVGGSFRVLRFSALKKLTRYKWNIVERGIKHHNPIFYVVLGYGVRNESLNETCRGKSRVKILLSTVCYKNVDI